MLSIATTKEQFLVSSFILKLSKSICFIAIHTAFHIQSSHASYKTKKCNMIAITASIAVCMPKTWFERGICMIQTQVAMLLSPKRTLKINKFVCIHKYFYFCYKLVIIILNLYLPDIVDKFMNTNTNFYKHRHNFVKTRIKKLQIMNKINVIILMKLYLHHKFGYVFMRFVFLFIKFVFLFLQSCLG